jgi:hypothetical protein
MEEASPTADLTTLLAKLRALQPGSPERNAYLDELARRVRANNYEADPQKIAARLLDEALRLEPSPEEDDSTEIE